MRREEEKTLEGLARIYSGEKHGKFERTEEYLENLDDTIPSEIKDRFARARVRLDNFSEEDWESPDLFAAERLFLEFFVTGQMEEDFHLIARDFLEHERGNLENYHELKYVEDRYDEDAPNLAFQNLIMNMMYSAYKSGSAFAKAQYQYLYKKYYKKEYNELKRFQEIELDYLAQAFQEEDTEDEACFRIARVLVMGKIFDMKIAPECYILITYLDDLTEEMDEEKGIYGFAITKEAREKAEGILLQIFDEEETLIKKAAESILYMMFVSEYFSFRPSYILDCENSYGTLHETYARALALYMSVSKKEEFSEEEIHLAATLFRVICVMADNTDDIYDQMCTLTGAPPYLEDSENEPLYDASRIPPPEEARQTVKGSVTDEEQKILSPQREQTLSEEVERLRAKVHALEQNEKGYLDTLAKKERVIRENETLLKKQEEEHTELVALRDHVYRLTESDEESPQISFEEMAEAIAPRRIVIIGGHDNWINKMKAEFPDWSFISRKASGIVDKDIVKNAEMVYFFTDTLAHSVYYRYMNLIREGKVAFGYIHGVNIERNVEQIYCDMGLSD